MRCRGGPFLLVAGAVVLMSCSQKPKSDGRPPLLLEEPGGTEKASAPATDIMADNSRCHVCHMNYADEEFAVQHARANIGCVQCHGESYAHAGDEGNVTPPDIMYAKEKINPSCLECHPEEKPSDVQKPVLAGTAEEKHCTDCHGKHRLAYRSVRWDKLTGKRLEQK